MNLDLIEELLNEEESATLDFKSEQYSFIKATDYEKGKLLKDILAFANSWRRTDAYILVGVKDVKGGRANVIGITSDLDDADIQEFVNYKTNRNIEFSYKTVSIDGVKIGVFHIPLQERPFYLKKDFANLKQNTVYIRRSSSTGEADLDEVAKMGSVRIGESQGSAIPKLELEFLDAANKVLLGNSITIQSKVMEYDKTKIDYRRYEVFDLAMNQYNTKFEGEMAKYIADVSLLSPITFQINNKGSILANDVRIRFSIAKTENLDVRGKHNFPDKPSRSKYNFNYKSAGINRIIEEDNMNWNFSINLGNIQPKAIEQSDTFFIGAKQPCKIDLIVNIFANNLPEPLVFPLAVNIETESQILDEKRLIDLN